MVLIPENGVTQQDIHQWYEMNQQLSTLRASEMLLRKKIFGGLFPNPVEGTNKHELGDGWLLKASYSLTRDIDPGALQAAKEMLVENKINPDLLVNYKPSLVKSAYNKLTVEQQALFDQVLVIKPGSPSMEVVLPKSAQKG